MAYPHIPRNIVLCHLAWLAVHLRNCSSPEASDLPHWLDALAHLIDPCGTLELQGPPYAMPENLPYHYGRYRHFHVIALSDICLSCPFKMGGTENYTWRQLSEAAQTQLWASAHVLLCQVVRSRAISVSQAHPTCMFSYEHLWLIMFFVKECYKISVTLGYLYSFTQKLRQTLIYLWMQQWRKKYLESFLTSSAK